MPNLERGLEALHASAKVDLAALLKEKGITRQKLADMSGMSIKAVYAAVKGERVSKEVAEAISDALGEKLDKLFSVDETGRTLSAKTDPGNITDSFIPCLTRP